MGIEGSFWPWARRCWHPLNLDNKTRKILQSLDILPVPTRKNAILGLGLQLGLGLELRIGLGVMVRLRVKFRVRENRIWDENQ